MSYCPKCGGSGELIDGTPCDCKARESDLYTDVACLEIPEAYRGIKFDSVMLPVSMGSAYKTFMQETFHQITSLRHKCKNMVICSPYQTGKSVLAYGAIQELFRKGIPVCPLYDIIEIRKMMLDYKNHDTKIYDVLYLFVAIPPILNYDVFDSAALLLSRRVRRGGSTIFLYDGNWNYLSAADQRSILTSLQGSGSLMSIEVNNWTMKKEE